MESPLSQFLSWLGDTLIGVVLFSMVAIFLERKDFDKVIKKAREENDKLRQKL